MLDDTIAVRTTEFGRTPCTQGADGLDLHNDGFSIWMAGGGIKAGIVHGSTDEIEFHAVEDGHDGLGVYATILRVLGLDSRRLEIPGRKCIGIEPGMSIRAILA